MATEINSNTSPNIVNEKNEENLEDDFQSVNMDSKEEESAGEIETDDFFMDDDIDKVINEFLEETDFIENEFSPLQEV